MNLLSSKLARRAIIGLVIVAFALIYFLRGGKASTRYVTAAVSRGSIIRSVIATGTVNPVTTVQVGSYVSGPIQAIYSDFNSAVKAGQLIAKIDPRPFQVKVDAAKATLDNAQAQLLKDEADMAYKKVTYGRNARLLDADVISRDTLDSAESSYRQAVAQVALDRANIEQQRANLQDAVVNLNYTNIVSPVDGTVVSRNVDVGQTVAASFQTPTLFLIAKDLTQMQVDTNVSESDIGNVHQGEAAEFTVDAFPNRTFQGTVTQVRQAPISIQNVVTYDVVVTVANPELLLRPGMTANVTIINARRDGVLRAPLQALRFSPDAERRAPSAGPSRQSRVWILKNDRLEPVTVVIGLDDGSNAEVISGNLRPGEMVVTAATREQGGARTAGSPFMPHFR
ncbi:MAG TPA: efflux RND transporter periplasmic adaptor subunit [Candidatus Binataceae bacterium]|nr:efflux RND transporter periplasmic adaptor subunit [Candidatus Binataceae bacterium]